MSDYEYGDKHPDLKPMTRLFKKQQEDAEASRKAWFERFRENYFGQDGERRRDREDDEDEEDVPSLYLFHVFYGFVKAQHNHVGIHHDEKVGKETFNYWIGLSNPPIFYMFDKIVIEDFQKYFPKSTTKDRWNAWKKEYDRLIREQFPTLKEDKKHYSFNNIFRNLKDRGYIQQLEVNDLDTSLENAVKHHLRLLHGPLTNKVKDPEKFAGECSEFAGRFLDKHAAEHISMAWKFTEKFFREQKEYQEIIKQKQNNKAKNT